MKDYFKRLKQHPGLEMATLMTILCALAGATNKSIEVVWHGALFGLIGGAVFFFGIVLLTNIKD